MLWNLKLIHMKGWEYYVDSHIGMGIKSPFMYRDGNPVIIPVNKVNTFAGNNHLGTLFL